MNIIAVIPARGGSKGVPLKNIRNIHGVPLIAKTIRAARDSRHVSAVYVSTDSDEIADVSLTYGAEVIRRDESLGLDTTSSEAVLIEALHKVKDKGVEADVLVFLQCTSPFLTAKDIDGTVDQMLNTGSQSAFAATPFYHFLWTGSDNGAQGINHDGLYRKRRQDLQTQYLEAGSVYVMQVRDFLEQKTRFCGKTAVYEIDNPDRAIEIDSACDFYMAQALQSWLEKPSEEKEHFRVKQVTFERKVKNIKAVVFDFDGVFTDDCVYVDENGREEVRCSREDGMGISLLKKSMNLRLLVLSTEHNECVKQRCRKLDLEVIHQCADKLTAIREWAEGCKLNLDEIMYCGNDVNDLPLMNRVGLFIAPKNAQLQVKEEADFVSDKYGGAGFVRDVCNMLLDYRDSFEKTNKYQEDAEDERPWGSWKVLELENNMCLKKIIVHPNKKLSYQSHEYRDEIWVCTRGEGIVIIDDDRRRVAKGDFIRIGKEQKHRIQNISQTQNLVLYEIQMGELLSEDDIFRYEDDFGRTDGK